MADSTVMKGNLRVIRLKQMQNYIAENGFVTIFQLCEKFGISKNTVRADISELADKGVVQKKYGGVATIEQNVVVSFTERQSTNMDEKERIGMRAAQLLEENDVICIDSGTTAACIMRAAGTFPPNITVITNNLSAIQEAAKYPNISVIVLPGRLERKTNSFVGVETIEAVKQYNFTKSFLGTTGISFSGGLTNSTSIEAKVKSEIIRNSKDCYLMACTYKIGQSNMVNFADISQFSGWICDPQNQDTVIGMGAKFGVKIYETE
jgi:DeoR family transcriptional regulator, myo-inositol catabolism operon repressor